MSRSGIRAQALAMCMLAAGLTAVWASGAQAAKWEVNGSTSLNAAVQVHSLHTLERTVNGSKVVAKDLSLITQAVGAKIEITCTGAELLGLSLQSEGKIAAGAKAKFTGCKTLINEKAAASCGPKSPGQPLGTIETRKLKGQLQLFAGKVVMIEPESGTELATIELGEECSVGEVVPVLGKFLNQDIALETKSLLHVAQESISSEMFIIDLKFEHRATTVGAAYVGLSGAHTGYTWRGLAE